MNTNLLSEIEHFIADTGMSAYSFGYKAARNGRLVERLRAGGRVWPETEVEVRTFMHSERSTRPRKEARAEA